MAQSAPPKLAAEKFKEIPNDVLADPLVQEAIADVSAIKLGTGKEEGEGEANLGKSPMQSEPGVER